MEEKKLTDMQMRFVEEYLIDLNATAAAKRAGYNPNSAKSQGARLLTNVDVQAEIARRKNAREKRVEITQDLIVQEAYKLYRACAVMVPKLDMTGDQAVDKDGHFVYQPLDAATARGTLDMLMKHTGAYDKDNKQKVTGLKIIWEDGSSDRDDAGKDSVQAKVSADGDPQGD